MDQSQISQEGGTANAATSRVDPTLERSRRFLRPPECLENRRQVVPDIGIVGTLGELRLKQRKVPLVLVALFPLVADMLEEEAGLSDHRAIVLGRSHNRVRDLLVHRALEADARIRAPQPVL